VKNPPARFLGQEQSHGTGFSEIFEVSNISIALEQNKPSPTVRHLAFGIFFAIALTFDVAVSNVMGWL
jgi:hypothetical protein